MSIRHRFAVLAGTVLVVGTLLAGAAYAAGPGPERALRAEALSDGEKQVLQQLHELRKSYREKLKSESNAVIDQAVQKGTITREQADRMKAHREKHAWNKKMHRMSTDELKQKLDEAVKAGKLTPEQANRILEHHKEHHS
ncbi:MAG TPA: DUF2680 domain-containing protein [Symbiobacteriaceae bacterium]|jgi:polyhydroxyalkanoate synthesis regulator phasin|nr:DUF2680 domain-containing protein [Symbiobacteriaceae bacterium]